MNRFFLIALLVLCAASPLQAQVDPEEIARRAASAAVGGPKNRFLELLDVDPFLEKRVGTAVWRGLTERQRDLLRSTARQRVLGMLAPPAPEASGVDWSAPLPPAPDGSVDVVVGLRLGDTTLKTRWILRRSGDHWRIRDVILADPGISLGQAAVATFGPQPLATRRRLSQALPGILPPALALLVIAIVVALAAPRLAAPRRRFLYLAAAGSALVFVGAGLLAARRLAAQPYDLSVPGAEAPWRKSEESALQAEREGRVEEARALWDRAVAAGAPAGPVAYQRGLAARQRGDLESARAFFQGALAASPPAPGAAKELAALDAGQGRLPEAERQITRYLAAAGPDPDALALAAVIATDVGKTAEAVASIGQARRLRGNGAGAGVELEAQIRARAGDAAGAVALLRPLANEGRLERKRLRADPAYLTIATDPAWVAFINEKKSIVDSR